MHIRSQENVICARFLPGLTSPSYVQQMKQESSFLPKSPIQPVHTLTFLLTLAQWHPQISWVILLDAYLIPFKSVPLEPP